MYKNLVVYLSENIMRIGERTQYSLQGRVFYFSALVHCISKGQIATGYHNFGVIL